MRNGKEKQQEGKGKKENVLDLRLKVSYQHIFLTSSHGRVKKWRSESLKSLESILFFSKFNPFNPLRYSAAPAITVLSALSIASLLGVDSTLHGV